ncbi:MAG: hypothetical protein IT371_01630 [Deltaproteobacteria bacterium]|nr:hypothetical protein [Deltaproteobacteria bacterium]
MSRTAILLTALAGLCSRAHAADALRLQWDGAQKQARAALSSVESAVRATGARLTVRWAATEARPTMLHGLAMILPGATDEERLRGFVDRYPGLVVSHRRELELVETLRLGSRRILRFQHVLQGVPVVGQRVTATFDARDRLQVVHSTARFVALGSTRPTASARQAVEVAWRTLAGATASPTDALTRAQTRLVILADGPARLAHQVVLPFGLDPRGRLHYVDAQTGAYLGHRPGVIWERTAASAEVRR